MPPLAPGVSLRPWPDTYRAALPLCGDPDWQPFEDFDAWQRASCALARTDRALDALTMNR